MDQFEKEEIGKLEPKYRPMGAWTYFGYSLLFSIPLVGLICLIVFSFNNDNINRRNFARSHFCGFLIYGILLAVTAIVTVFAFSSALGGIAAFLEQLLQQLEQGGAGM